MSLSPAPSSPAPRRPALEAAVPPAWAPSAPLLFGQEAVADEVPLFAASADYAWDRGGPLTRAFLTAVARGWPMEDLVLDSTLAWLRPGLAAGDPRWHREVYPREARGAFARANAEVAVQHVACVFGVAALPELVAPSPILGDLPEVIEAGRWSDAAHAQRHAQIEALVTSGRVSAAQAELGRLHAYDGGTFLKEGRAAASGFRFWIRATLGTARPVANGLRNVSTVHR